MATVGNRRGQFSVRSGEQTSTDDDNCRPADGKVENVVRKWAVYEDRVLADRIQNEEIEQHYNKNRQHRRTVREDIPVAKDINSEETARAQYERMKQLEEQRKIAENDERLARELQGKLTDAEREEQRRKRLHDEVISNHMRQVRQQSQRAQMHGGPVAEDRTRGPPQEFARHMQEREARRRHEQNQYVSSPEQSHDRRSSQPPLGPSREHVSTQGESGVEQRHGDTPAGDYQQLSEAVGGPTLASLQHTTTYSSQASYPDEEFDDEALEAEDRELAVRLQREEEERYERKKQQRMLAKERKRLERLIEQSRRQESGGLRYPAAPSRANDSDFSDFYIPPDPKMNPEQSRRLQEEQDAELARLMQDQEQGSGGDDLRARLKELEAQDLELAQIIQEEENLRAKRRKLRYQQKLLQQQREVAERLASQSHSPSQTIVSHSSSQAAHMPSARPSADTSMSQGNNNRAADVHQNSTSGFEHSPGIGHSTVSSTDRGNDYQPARQAGRSAGVPPRSDSHQENRLEASAVNMDKRSEREVGHIRLDHSNVSASVRSPDVNRHSDADSTSMHVTSRGTKTSVRAPDFGRELDRNTTVTSSVSRDSTAVTATSASIEASFKGSKVNSRGSDLVRNTDKYTATSGGVSKGPTANSRQPKIPINLPGRMMQNTDADARLNSHRVMNDLPTRDAEGSDGHVSRQDRYAEKPSVGRGGRSPSKDSRDLSPPGPALPERRYRDHHPSLSQQIIQQQGAVHHSAVSNQSDAYRGHPHPLTEANVRGHDRQQPLQLDVRGQGQPMPGQDMRGVQMPPYRGLHPPPYPSHYHSSNGSHEGPPSSPRSADTHYDAPWDMSQLESQLLRDASFNQSQPIIPRQVSPPGRNGPAAAHQSPPLQGEGGRPLLIQNEDGQIVMNIAEMIDPTYQRRSGHRSDHHSQEGPSDGEITAVAGQRRSGKKNAGKRESCKQQ
ncbi:caldesmon-like isoform X2 [Watersipora subatra]|uniref:caldesmon-like isoform X2 n=1 Tax=Watersipora subatra TaxID=2589382 RepID=UPI00355C10A2